MLLNGWQIVELAYERYAATGVVQLLLISAVMIILIRDKKRENKHFAYYIITLLIILFLPPVAFLFGKYFIGEDVYWRVFWLIPSVLVIAFVATKLVEQQGRTFQKKITFLAITVLIILGGKFIYNSENYTKSTNPYKIPQEVIEICEMVAPEGTTKIVVPETIVSYIRQYNPKIDMLYGRSLGKDTKKGKNYQFLLQLNSPEPDIPYIAEYARGKKCSFVIFENTSVGIEEMVNYGYEQYGSTASYTIFKDIQ